jgi:hypothetical protein
VRRKRFLIFRFLGIILLFLFVPTYIDYEELIEADFPSSKAKYEVQDIENFPIDKQLNFTIVSGLSSVFSLSGNNPFDSLTGPSLETPFSAQKPFTLRC